MASLAWSSPVGRAILALAVFTFAFWALALVAFLTWAPGRSLAAATVARFVEPVVPAAGTPLGGSAGGEGDTALCDDGSGYSFGIDTDDDGFSWALLERDGDVQVEPLRSWHDHVRSRSGRPTFWFQEGGQSYSVDDPDIVAEVRRVTEPLAAIGRQMGQVGAAMGRHGAAMGRIGGRMGSIGARLGMLEARLAMRGGASQNREWARESVRRLRAEMEALRRQFDGEQVEHALSQRGLSRRMSELSARHQVVLRDVRVKVREIARRLRREGKAERPHANA